MRINLGVVLVTGLFAIACRTVAVPSSQRRALVTTRDQTPLSATPQSPTVVLADGHRVPWTTVDCVANAKHPTRVISISELTVVLDEDLPALDKKEVEAVVRRNIQQVQWCYEHELLNNKPLDGTIVVRWLIQPSGEVEAVAAESDTVGSEFLSRCVLHCAAEWRFPAGTGRRAVNGYPFIFKSRPVANP